MGKGGFTFGIGQGELSWRDCCPILSWLSFVVICFPITIPVYLIIMCQERLEKKFLKKKGEREMLFCNEKITKYDTKIEDEVQKV